MTDLDPNTLFKGDDLHPGQQVAPPWDPFWDCRNFAESNCTGDCDNCHLYDAYEGPADVIDLLCEAKW